MSVSTSSSSLEDELNSIIRVRSRLSGTPDTNLSIVLGKLLPRLLSKLNNNAIAIELSQEQQRQNLLLNTSLGHLEDLSPKIKIRQKIQIEISELLSTNVMERIRIMERINNTSDNNEQQNTIDVMPWIESISLYLISLFKIEKGGNNNAVVASSSTSLVTTTAASTTTAEAATTTTTTTTASTSATREHVVVTPITLSFIFSLLQFGLARINTNNNKKGDIEIINTVVLEGLIRVMHYLQQEEGSDINNEEEEEQQRHVVSTNDNKPECLRRSNIRSVTWLFLNCIALVKGLKPFIGTEKKKKNKSNSNNKNGDDDHNNAVLLLDDGDGASSNVQEAMKEIVAASDGDDGDISSTSKMFELILDVLLFWPTQQSQNDRCLSYDSFSILYYEKNIHYIIDDDERRRIQYREQIEQHDIEMRQRQQQQLQQEFGVIRNARGGIPPPRIPRNNNHTNMNRPLIERWSSSSNNARSSINDDDLYDDDDGNKTDSISNNSSLSFLTDLKAACLQYAVACEQQEEQQHQGDKGLFCPGGGNNNTSHDNDVNRTRSLLLLLLTIVYNPNSKAGIIASDYLHLYLGGGGGGGSSSDVVDTKKKSNHKRKRTKNEIERHPTVQEIMNKPKLTKSLIITTNSSKEQDHQASCINKMGILDIDFTLSLSCCIFILILGDCESLPILLCRDGDNDNNGDAIVYSAAKYLYEPILGERPGIALRRRQQGQRTNIPSRNQRLPLPLSMSVTLVEIITTSLLKQHHKQKQKQDYGGINFKEERERDLFIGLALAVAKHVGKVGIVLVHAICTILVQQHHTGGRMNNNNLKPKISDDGSNDDMEVDNDGEYNDEDFYQQCLSMSIGVLELAVREQNDTPAGRRLGALRQEDVDEEFDDDADDFLNRVMPPMIRRRMQARNAVLQRRHQQRGLDSPEQRAFASQCRTKCYQMVCMLAKYMKLHRQEGTTSGDEDNDKKDVSNLSLDMAILFFKCAVYEEEKMLQEEAIRALAAVQTAYKDLLFVDEGKAELRSGYEETNLRHLIAPLLPYMSSAACCNSSAVRLEAAKWTSDLLLYIDPSAACHLCCYLADDVNNEVSELAASILKKYQSSESFKHSTTTTKATNEEKTIRHINRRSNNDREVLFADLDNRIAVVANKANIPEPAASILLYNFDFSVDDTLTCLQSEGGDAAALARFGIGSRCMLHRGDSVEAERTVTGSEFHECGICYDDEMKSNDMHAMPCGHEFCLGCWKAYIEAKFDEGPRMILNGTCPDSTCNERITVTELETVAPGLIPKWRDHSLTAFLEKDVYHSACPGEDCPGVIVASYIPDKVSCNECATQFCFRCRDVPHAPATCKDLKAWYLGFDSTKWIKRHTKPCPSCNIPIEKNKGCNHMNCTSCDHHFCWICLADLNENLSHECNSLSDEDNGNEAKRKLFYWNRFQAHDDAQVFARRQNEEREEQYGHLLNFLENKDLDTITKSGDALVDCRQFLKYSYMAAYSRERKADIESKRTFERLQATLELFTEKLSRLTETDIEELYGNKGNNVVRMHIRALSFHTVAVINYAERLILFLEEIRGFEVK